MMQIGFIAYQTKHGFIQSTYVEAIADKLKDEADIIIDNMDEEDMPQLLTELTGNELNSIIKVLNIDETKDTIKVIINNQDKQSIKQYLDNHHSDILMTLDSDYIVYFTDWL